MNFDLLAVGDRMPPWVDDAVSDYAPRFRPPLNFRVRTVSAVRRGRGTSTRKAMETEGQRLLDAAPANALLIALTVDGRVQSTAQFAARLREWIDEGQNVAMMVGGADGLSEAVLSRVSESWSLSRFTFAHPVARVVVIEQLYRAYSILQGLPYHRG